MKSTNKVAVYKKGSYLDDRIIIYHGKLKQEMDAISNRKCVVGILWISLLCVLGIFMFTVFS